MVLFQPNLQNYQKDLSKWKSKETEIISIETSINPKEDKSPKKNRDSPILVSLRVEKTPAKKKDGMLSAMKVGVRQTKMSRI